MKKRTSSTRQVKNELGLVGKTMLVVNILAVVFTLAAYISPTIDPARFWIFSLFGLAYPILLILNLFFVGFWLLKSFRYAFLSGIVLAIGYIHFKGYYAFNGTKAGADAHSFSVVSYNISNARKGYDKNSETKKEKVEAMSAFLQRFADEDIICLQEVGPYATDLIKKNFSHPYVHQLEKGTVILSRFKMVNKGIIDFGTVTNSCLWADIVTSLDTIRVYSLHLQSNQISDEADHFLDQEDRPYNERWTGLKGILGKYVNTHITRTRQATTVKKHAQDSPHPVVLCGDLNDTPMTKTYRIMSDGFIDHFSEAGNGFGTTFNGRIPFLRIDYIFSDRRFKVQHFNIIREDFSDHYPIASLITLKPVR